MENVISSATNTTTGTSMGETQNSSKTIATPSSDIGWQYGVRCDPNNPDKVKCLLCGKPMSGGIYRIKQHIAHIKGNVSSCLESTDDDKAKCLKAINETHQKRRQKHVSAKRMREEVSIINEEVRAMEMEENETSEETLRKPTKYGPINRYISNLGPKQSTLQSEAICKKIRKEKNRNVGEYMATWIYESGIPFNAVDNDSFRRFTEALGQFGPGYEQLSRYELSGPYLKNAVDKTKALLKIQEEEWKVNGCSIMTDAWSDRKRRSIMNLCVNCTLGTTFRSSMEASSDSHTGRFIFEYVEKCIEEIGPQYVVQVVTDNASNNMAAKDILREERPSIFWTSCATHTINLMLQDIGGITRYKSTIEKAKSFTNYIYAHHKTLHLMRKFTNKKDIVRPGVTRFATSFLTLQSLWEKKDELRSMVASKEWSDTKHAKSRKGKAAADIAWNESFWSLVSFCLKVFAPLYKVLRIVDGDNKPSMGFVYGEMIKAKEEIKNLFKTSQHYTIIWDIIDKKALGRLDSPLHMAGFLLNPYYTYQDVNHSRDMMVMNGFLECVERMYPNDHHIQDLVGNKELHIYLKKEGLFGRGIALRACSTNDAQYDPVRWWDAYGRHVPNLQRFAIRVLGLTTSSSGCERAWSTFEGIHTKKRNRLDVERVNNLAFVQLNSKMIKKKSKQMENKVEFLLSNDSTNAQEWLVHGGGDDDDENPTNEMRELDEDDFVSDEEEEENMDYQFEDEHDQLLEAYGNEQVLEEAHEN